MTERRRANIDLILTGEVSHFFTPACCHTHQHVRPDLDIIICVAAGAAVTPVLIERCDSVFCPVTGPLKAVAVRMEPVEEEEAVVVELKRRLEDEDLNPEQRVSLLNNGLNSETTTSITPVCLHTVRHTPVCLRLLRL